LVGDHSILKKSYLIDDYHRDTLDHMNYSIHVEAHGNNFFDETDFVFETMQNNPNSKIIGLVGRLDMTNDDVASISLRCREKYGSYMKGFRELINYIEGQPSISFIKEKEPFICEKWQQNLRILEQYGYHFEIHLYYQQLKSFSDHIFKQFPNLTFVINHTACPVFFESPEYYEQWKDAMTYAATFPNVIQKLSGLAMFTTNITKDNLANVF